MNNSSYFFYNINMKTFYKLILILYIFTLLFAPISIHIAVSLILLIALKWIPYTIYRIEYLLYIYLSQVLGSVYGFYLFPYYDKCIHFLSGCLIVLIANKYLKPYQLPSKIFYIFINTIEMSIAFLWEIFEYCGLVFFQHDASRHFTTGVHDTMQDMIVSMIGGLIITYLIYKFPSCIDSLYISQQDTQMTTSQQSHT